MIASDPETADDNVLVKVEDEDEAFDKYEVEVAVEDLDEAFDKYEVEVLVKDEVAVVVKDEVEVVVDVANIDSINLMKSLFN